MAKRFVILGLITLLLFVLNIFVGSVSIPAESVLSFLLGEGEAGPERFIVLESRLPQALTAMLAGAALTVSGLLLQTAFRNPLAGPSILGITSGGSLGVAMVMLFMGGSISAGAFSIGGSVAILLGAFLGCVAVMGILLLFSMWLRNELMLLITGIMVGYLASSVITLLNYISSAEGIQGFTMWGMGTFSGVGLNRIPLFSAVVLIGLILALLMAKPLNVILLGENYARNLGVSMYRVRNLLLLATGILTSVVTAYCGPVGFIGLAVPHIVRMIFRTADHRVRIPACIVTGAAIGLLCNLMCVVYPNIVLPLNGVTPIIGVPVVLYVILKERVKR